MHWGGRERGGPGGRGRAAMGKVGGGWGEGEEKLLYYYLGGGGTCVSQVRVCQVCV